MRSLALSLTVGGLVFAAVTWWVGSVAAILPAVLVFAVIFVMISRRVGAKVQVGLEAAMPLLQQRKIKQGRAQMRKIQDQFSPWQPFLRGQIEVQLGMLDYMQLRFDAALPQLESGSWRNWPALLCIGIIKNKGGDLEAAVSQFEKARRASKKEPMVYLVWARVLLGAGKRDEALAVLIRGKKVLPDNQNLTYLRDCIANKKKPNHTRFGQTWLQFFPEEAAAAMQTRKGPMPGAGFRQGKISKKARRGR